MINSNDYILQLKPYSLASHLIWDASAVQRKNILKLDWNEATIPPTPLVKNRVMDWLKNDDYLNIYPDTYNKKLLYKIAEYAGVDITNIQLFVGSDSAHEHILRTYIRPNDKVLIIGPTYDNFRLTAESQGGIVSYFNLQDNNVFDLAEFRRISSNLKPRLIYICNPNNPTGSTIDVNTLLKIIDENLNSVILLDEAYYEFYKITLKNYVPYYKNLIISRTFSKAFAIANLRAGYIISNSEVIGEISKIRNSKSICTITQISVIAVLDDLDYTNRYVEQVEVAREYFSSALQEFNFVKRIYPSDGNFILVEFRDNIIQKRVMDCLTKNFIFVRELSHSLLLRNCLRFTIGLSSQMQRVVDVLRTV